MNRRGLRPGETVQVDARGTRWLRREESPDLARVRRRLDAEIEVATENLNLAQQTEAREWRAGKLAGLKQARELLKEVGR